jgi:hypothetical protein
MKLIRVCDYCGKEFESNKKHTNRNKHYFCSRECFGKYRIKKQLVYCDWCGNPITKKKSDISRSKHNFCDRGCYLDYISFAVNNVKNKVVCGKLLHRTVAELRLGRTLKSTEEVHHIDGNHKNNSIDNLVVISKSEHAKIHARIKQRDKNGKFIKNK